MGPRDFIVTPKAWLPSGETVVYGENKRLVIWNGIPGERAEVHVFGEGQHQDRGRVREPDGDPHPWRRIPPCDRYDPCGGCPLMHVVPVGQNDARLTLMTDALREQGLGGLAPRSIVASPDGDEGFRHTLNLAVGLSDQRHIRVGARGREAGRVVPIPGCLVVTPALREAMRVVSHHVIDLAIQPYEHERDRGVLRAISMRQSRATGELLITLVAGRKASILWELAESVAGGLSSVAGLHLHLNDDPEDSLFQRDEHGAVGVARLRGKDAIEESLAGLRLRLGPGDAFPANPGMTERLASDLRSALAPDATRPLVDLHCGPGTMTLAVGGAHAFALGVDSSPSTVERARENASLNRINAEFMAGSVMDLLPDISRRLGGTGPVVLLDAGRTGLDPALSAAVRGLEPSRVALLSRDPRHMARTLADHAAAGWKIDGLTAYEMVPQTAEVGMLALLRPAAPPSAERRAPRRRVIRA